MAERGHDKSVEAIMTRRSAPRAERCLAGSVLVPVGRRAGPLRKNWSRRPMLIGDGTDHRPNWVRWSRMRIGRGARLHRKGLAEGATPVDGRQLPATAPVFFAGPTIFDNVTPQMTIAKEKIFGPVLSVIRVKRWMMRSTW